MTTEPKLRTVLFVDDEAYLLSALVRAFRKYTHWQSLTATSGEQALALLEVQHVDAIVSDMRMPRMHGSELLDLVGKRYPAICRVMLTGSTSGEIIIPDYHMLYKPCKVESLIRILDGPPGPP